MTVNRAPITRWLLAELGELAPTGDVLAPTEGGWHMGKYKPYVDVAPGTATVTDQAQGAPWKSWSMQYRLTFYGVDRNQVETLADQVRSELLSKKAVLRKQRLDGERVLDMHCTSIGAIGYTKQLDPPGYSQTDTYTLSVEMQ